MFTGCYSGRRRCVSEWRHNYNSLFPSQSSYLYLHYSLAGYCYWYYYYLYQSLLNKCFPFKKDFKATNRGIQQKKKEIEIMGYGVVSSFSFSFLFVFSWEVIEYDYCNRHSTANRSILLVLLSDRDVDEGLRRRFSDYQLLITVYTGVQD